MINLEAFVESSGGEGGISRHGVLVKYEYLKKKWKEVEDEKYGVPDLYLLSFDGLYAFVSDYICDLMESSLGIKEESVLMDLGIIVRGTIFYSKGINECWDRFLSGFCEGETIPQKWNSWRLPELYLLCSRFSSKEKKREMSLF
jgi:hypothetical protein